MKNDVNDLKRRDYIKITKSNHSQIPPNYECHVVNRGCDYIEVYGNVGGLVRITNDGKVGFEKVGI